MSRFNDANSLDDILGCVWLAQTWGPESDFNIHDLIAEIADRISEKIGRSRNAVRRNWFANALEQVKVAAMSYEQNKCADGEEFLRRAEQLLQQGNKTHRRSTRFIVGTDGTAEKA